MLPIQHNITLAPYTTFHIGGVADAFLVAQNREDIIEGIAWAKKQGIPFFILGSGANILIGDKGFRGLVIKNETSAFSITGSIVKADSGVTIDTLIAQTLEKGLSGFEHFAGIPSTVGGALWQNLHFLTPDRSETFYIADIVSGATVLSEKGVIEEVGPGYFSFTYDWSILHKNHAIVLDATFELMPEERKELEKRRDANLLWRETKHPQGAVSTSAGSVFKKIEGYGAGRLIDEVGLKGKRIGGAKISERHANFIINDAGATASDVRSLITLVQKEVKEKLDLVLEPEISFVGDF